MRILTESPEYKPAKEILGKDATYRIPKYQRGYDWGEEYIEDLISDLKTLVEAKEIARNSSSDDTTGRKHFFGGIVLVRKEESEEIGGYTTNVTRYEIIDGQQRLTTFTLVLKAISEMFNHISDLAEESDDGEKSIERIKEDSNQSKREIEDEFLNWRHRTYRDHKELKVTLSRRDDDFYRKLVRDRDADPDYESNKRIQEAYDMIYDEVENMLYKEDGIKDKYVKLSDLYNAVLDDCEYVVLSTSNKGQANRLFSVLNDRGKSLSETSLVRARTIEILDDFPTHQEIVERKWDDILKRESDVEDFLRDFYTSVWGEKPPRRNLHDPFEEDIIKDTFGISIDTISQKVENEDEADDVQDLVEQIVSEAKVYFQIIDGDWPYEDNEVDKWHINRLHRLSNVLGHSKAYPVLLSAHKSLPQEDFSDICHLFEMFMFRYIVISDARPSSIDDIYFSQAQIIRHTPDDYHIHKLKLDLKDLISNNIGEGVFNANFHDIFEYYSRSPNIKERIKHLLTTIESYLKSLREAESDDVITPKTDVIFDIDSQDIEHIYPRNPTDETESEDMNEMVNSVGNLTVLHPSINQALGNKKFEEKREHFEDSSLTLNQEIASKYSDWTAENISDRAKSLAEDAKKIFHPLSIIPQDD